MIKKGWKKGLPVVGTVVVGAVIVAVFFWILGLRISGEDKPQGFGPGFPPGGPAEFLYLDSGRVAAYLAQVEGGTSESEKLTRKVTQSLNAKLQLAKLGEAGGSEVEETFAERLLKPTAASSFFALRSALIKNEVMKVIRPRFFKKDVRGLPEGQFVTFKTSALLPPIYLNAYLAVKHAHTLAAIFPGSPARRKAAKSFLKKVGPNPRALFALQPFVTAAKQKTLEAAIAREANEANPEPARLVRKPFVYLLPVNAQLLSSERSLLKYGGGKFTVVGKLIRRFPEPTRFEPPAYVDSATLETWAQAIRRAPGDLLCRTAPICVARHQHLSVAARHEAIDDARSQILSDLKTQTSIANEGAVILPVAIYK